MFSVYSMVGFYIIYVFFVILMNSTDNCTVYQEFTCVFYCYGVDI